MRVRGVISLAARGGQCGIDLIDQFFKRLCYNRRFSFPLASLVLMLVIFVVVVFFSKTVAHIPSPTMPFAIDALMLGSLQVNKQ